MTTHYISSWKIYTSSIGQAVQEAVKAEKVKPTDIVWTGPSGDAIISESAADLDEEYADYTDSGLVSEYLA
jgi:hypothetical protein